jgi:hypothetical protein
MLYDGAMQHNYGVAAQGYGGGGYKGVGFGPIHPLPIFCNFEWLICGNNLTRQTASGANE